jgi:hypothetical protein
MIHRILSERNEYSKLENYDTYGFYNYSTKTNLSGKVLFSDDMHRKLVIDYFGRYHSIPTRETYSVLSEQLKKMPGDNGRLYLFCPEDACKLVVQPTLFINNNRVGYIYKQGFFYVDLKPGNHTLTFDYEGDRPLSSLIKSQVQSAGPLTVNIEKNKHYYVRFNHPGWVSVGYGAKEVSEDEALTEIENLQYKGTN